MSGPLSDRAAGLLSAALRHLRDADLLLTPAGEHGYISPDQAFHLAPFGPECARKAALDAPWLDKLLGHDHGCLVDGLFELAEALSLHTAHVPPNTAGLENWHIECRYRRTGTVTPAEARKLVDAAREFVDDTVMRLWCDGRLDGSASPW